MQSSCVLLKKSHPKEISVILSVLSHTSQDMAAVRTLEEKSIREDIGGIEHYATLLLWRENLLPH